MRANDTEQTIKQQWPNCSETFINFTRAHPLLTAVFSCEPANSLNYFPGNFRFSELHITDLSSACFNSNFLYRIKLNLLEKQSFTGNLR